MIQSKRTTRAANPTANRLWTVWVWNVPLLVGTLAVLLIIIPVLTGLYFWQSARIGNQLLQLADVAVSKQEPSEEVRWLKRYMALYPSDHNVQVRLAKRTDDLAQQGSEIEQARRQLSKALSMTAETPENEVPQPLEDQLRRRLIERLVQLGGGWHVEAQRQIILLNPDAGDPWALQMLARSMLTQTDALESSVANSAIDTDEIDREEKYWNWAVSRPVGEVLQLAVDANPDSVELASLLVDAYLDKPGLFDLANPSDGSLVEAKQQRLQKATRLVRLLSEQTADGSAQWAAYVFAGRKGIDVQRPNLKELAKHALQRLSEQTEQLTASSADSTSTDTNLIHVSDDQSKGDTFGNIMGVNTSSGPRLIEPEVLDLAITDNQRRKAYYADVRIVLAYGQELLKNKKFGEALDQFQAVVNLPTIFTSAGQLELAYLGAGQAHWRMKQPFEACEIWTQGGELLQGRSLLLLEPLAIFTAQTGTFEQARAALDKFLTAIDSASLQLNSISSADLRDGQYDQLQHQLNSATWRVDVLEAKLDMRRGKYQAATKRLERALASQLMIDPESRIDAAKMLANIYGQQNLWDMAGRVLDEAAVLNPADIELRQQAAIAWERASAGSRAVESWRLADDGSFGWAISFANAIAAQQSSLAPDERRIEDLQSAVAEAENRLNQLASKDQNHQDAWRLELLKLSLPNPAAKSEATREDRINNLKELSEANTDIAELQATAALALRRAGFVDESLAAAKRLRSIDGLKPEYLLRFNARFALANGQQEDAVTLVENAVSDTKHKNAEIATFAASFLSEVGKHEEAIQVLNQLDANRHTPDSLLQLGDLLLANLSAIVKPQDTLSLDQVCQRLMTMEGAAGTRWRLLKAKSLLNDQASKKDLATRLQQASELYQEIAAKRPRWSQGLVLGGRIAAAQGDSSRAAELFRRSIAAGERKASTVLLLVQSLNKIGNVEAAERELQRLDGTFIGSSAPVSSLAVGMAMQQGNLEEALRRARDGAASRPDDSQALLLLAQAAITAARLESSAAKVSANDQQVATQSTKRAAKSSEKLLKEARQSLSRALEASRGRDLGVWLAQFRFQLETEGYTAARQVLEAMGESELPEDVRYLATANGYLAVNDFAEVRVWIDKARKANPSDPMVSMAQAKLAQATNDNQTLVKSYEEAYRLAPHEDGIRRRLAVALAVTATDQIPWQRIDQLIGPDRRGSTQTDRLYRALIMINRGSSEQIRQAEEMLRTEIATGSPNLRDDATRLLLTSEKRRWEESLGKEDRAKTKLAFERCVQLYKKLVSVPNPAVNDLYGYGDLLLRSDQTQAAKRLENELLRHHPESPPTLSFRLKLANQQSVSGADVKQIAQLWLQAQPEDADVTNTVNIACAELLKSQYSAAAVELAAEQYAADKRLLQNYVFILSQIEDYSQIVEVCLDHLKQVPNPEPLQLMAEALTQSRQLELVDQRVTTAMRQGLNLYDNDLKMLEAIGTLNLMLENYPTAIEAYLMAERINPTSLITLNNLSVALSETSGREREAIPRARRVVDLYGRDPELLDTLGVALLRAGELEEAERVLREACQSTTDPRYQFHLVQVLEARDQEQQAKELWLALDHQSIQRDTLSPRDRQSLSQLKKKVQL